LFVGAIQDGDLQGAVSKTSTGLSNLTDGLKERAKGFEESIKEVSGLLAGALAKANASPH